MASIELPNVAYADRFPARLKNATDGDLVATPEGPGDAVWDAADETLKLPNVAGDAYVSYPLAGASSLVGAAGGRGSISISGLTSYTVAMTVEDSDASGMINLGGQPTRITIASPGVYLITANFNIYSNSTALSPHRLGAIVRKNGVDFRTLWQHPTTYTDPDTYGASPCTQLVLAAADYLELKLTFPTQQAGGTLSFAYFGAWRLI